MKIIPKFRTGNELKAKEKWDTWFEDYRVPNESGQYATQEDWDNLNNALPELYDLEKQISDTKSNVYKNYIKWKKDPNNTDDRVFIAQEYYKKNHPEYDYEKPWYSGQARWKTNYQYPGQDVSTTTDKVTRFPYYSKNGMTWWSNSPEYAQTYADYYDSEGHGSRLTKNDEQDITGTVFQAYFPKNITGSLDLQGPEIGYYDQWTNLPYKVTNNSIERIPNNELQSSKGLYTTDKGKRLSVRKPIVPKEERLKTDDVVDAANKQGHSAVYLHQVGDGPTVLPSGFEYLRPIEELITLPSNQQNQQGISIKGAGFSPTPGKRKDGTPYLYANNNNKSLINYAKRGTKLVKKYR